jgi:hypothetical protein
LQGSKALFSLDFGTWAACTTVLGIGLLRSLFSAGFGIFMQAAIVEAGSLGMATTVWVLVCYPFACSDGMLCMLHQPGYLYMVFLAFGMRLGWITQLS